MSTEKKPFLNIKLIEQASLTLRAFKHRFRMAILNALMKHGPLSSEALADLLQLELPYIDEQIRFLVHAQLVLPTTENRYRLNEKRLSVVNASLTAFSEKNDLFQ